jgi:hypothetical protein
VDEKHDKPELFQRLILTGGANQSPCDGWLRQVMNVSVPVEARGEAELKLAEHCRTHNIFQVLRSIVDHESDSVAVRAAIVRAMPVWDEALLATTVIVGALSVPRVRVAAVETLERMGAARGEKEVRLLRHLASLRPGGWAKSQSSPIICDHWSNCRLPELHVKLPAQASGSVSSEPSMFPS